MIDAVHSFHVNPDTCGVTKFNVQLAEKLGVPHAGLWTPASHPLLSIKWAELDDTSRRYVRTLPPKSFDLFWHDDGPSGISARAERVYCASEIGCPSTLQGDATRKGLTILSFGMAHKFQEPLFRTLKRLLDATQQDYTICVSSAMHEGSPWDTTTKAHTARMRDVFGDHLRWLGFLADDALAREIRDAHAIALFYDPGVRANNTTLWAALDAGTPVITNLDQHSPSVLQHDKSVFDVQQLAEWPVASQLREIRFGGRKAAEVYSWDRVLEHLCGCHV